jgi:hypothetical protein
MKLQCKGCWRELDAEMGAHVLGGVIYEAICPKDGDVAQVVPFKETTVNAEGFLVCPTCGKSVRIDMTVPSKQISSTYKVCSGVCPEDGPVCNRG